MSEGYGAPAVCEAMSAWMLTARSIRQAILSSSFRLIRTLRMRLRLMGAFANPQSAERAVFGQLLRWHLILEITHRT